MLEYPHPLDYVTGIKYTILDEALPVDYDVSSETFQVEEVVDFNELGFNKEHGEYAVLRVIKKNTEMFRALSLISNVLGVPKSNLFYFGLKDKNALTTSYVFVKSTLVDPRDLPITRDGIVAELLGYTRVKPRKRFFQGNRFRVIIDGFDEDVARELKKMIEKIEETGLPSYYGYQRFGARRYNTHLLGKLILNKREDLFSYYFLRSLYPLEEYESTVSRITGDYSRLRYEKTYVKSSLQESYHRITRELNNIFVDAYASYLFNLLLNSLIEKQGVRSLDRDLPMPGCLDQAEIYRDILKAEGVDHDVLSNLPCFHRAGLFKPFNNSIRVEHGRLIYEFQLRPGMYASIVIRELFKDRLMFRD